MGFADYEVIINKEPLTAARLASLNATLLFIAGPNEPISEAERKEIKSWMDAGGCICVFLSESANDLVRDSVNAVLQGSGITVNKDSVVRTVYYKYLHPKEVYIGKGVVNKPFGAAILKLANRGRGADSKSVAADAATVVSHTSALTGTLKGDPADNKSIEIAYPRGCTLTTSRPATPLLSSGAISYPVNRPIIAASEVRPAAKGAAAARVAVVGSTDMFADDWLSKENNASIADALFRWILSRDKTSGNDGKPKLSLETADVDTLLAAVTAFGATMGANRGKAGGIGLMDGVDAEISDQYFVPDTQTLAEKLRSCLQESEALQRDSFLTSMYDDTLFTFDMRRIPEAIKMFDTLGVKHEPLSLIPPQFETPLPPLQPAVFPPILRELPPPALDLFDLDEHFASDTARLAQLTNKWYANLFNGDIPQM